MDLLPRLTIGLTLAIAPVTTLAADPAPPDRRQLVDEVRRLQRRVEQLERQSPAARPDAAAVDRAVADVVADAGRRAQFLQSPGFAAGHDGRRFVIQSEDGSFSLSPGLFAQFRYVADYRDSAAGGTPGGGGGGDDTQAGFEMRRLRFTLDGNAFAPSTTYHVQWATGRVGGTLVLEEAWVRYQFSAAPLALRLGTFANPFAHETGVHAGRQLAVDRSIPHEIFAGGGTGTENYVQGAEAVYQPTDALRLTAAYHDGFNSRNTNFADAGGGSPLLGLADGQWGAYGRVEVKLAGDWRAYDDFSARDTKKDLLVLGVGGDVDAGRGLTAYFHTADAQWEPAAVPGLGVYAAYYGLLRDFRSAAAGVEDRPYDWGAVAQVGYLLNPRWEVFGRYGYTSLDAGAPTGTGTLGAAARAQDTIHELTIGVHHYFRGDAAKVTVDVTYLPDGSPVDLNGIGVLAQPAGDPQFVVRGQLQLWL